MRQLKKHLMEHLMVFSLRNEELQRRQSERVRSSGTSEKSSVDWDGKCNLTGPSPRSVSLDQRMDGQDFWKLVSPDILTAPQNIYQVFFKSSIQNGDVIHQLLQPSLLLLWKFSCCQSSVSFSCVESLVLWSLFSSGEPLHESLTSV